MGKKNLAIFLEEPNLPENSGVFHRDEELDLVESAQLTRKTNIARLMSLS